MPLQGRLTAAQPIHLNSSFGPEGVIVADEFKVSIGPEESGRPTILRCLRRTETADSLGSTCHVEDPTSSAPPH